MAAKSCTVGLVVSLLTIKNRMQVFHDYILKLHQVISMAKTKLVLKK